MRKTLFKYLIKELFIYFFVSFIFFFLIFFINQILLMAEEILSKRAPIHEVALLVVFALPSIIATSAPFAALVGTLMGVGRLVSDREILAMNALGVPVQFIVMPVLVTGLLISVVSFMTNDILLPAGTIEFTKLYKKILTSTPALELESNSIKRNQNAIVISGSIHNEIMDGLLVIDTDNSGNKRIVASSKANIIKSTEADVLMSLNMNNAVIASFDKKDRGVFDVIEAKGVLYNILTRNILSSYSGAVSPHEMSSIDLYRELKKREQKDDKKTVNLYKMEFHKKFTIPFAAFFFTILAFPLGLSAKTNGQSTGFILGLIIAILYWALLIGGQTLSLRLGFDGAFMMWLPDLAILGFGLLFMGRRLVH
jgi:lipopolysaccharide export system permease protein